MQRLTAPLRFLDAQIDRLGMYRVVTLALGTLTLWSLVCALFGWLPYSFLELLISLAVVVLVGMVSNWLLALMFRVHTNHESALITSLIVFFLVLPAQLSQLELSFIIALVVVLAMLSKYVLVWRKQHILNPVASGAVAAALVYAVYPLPPGYFETSWWIGQPVLFVPLVLVGTAVVHKVRKWTLVFTFLSVGFLFFLYEEWQAVVYFEGIQYAGLLDPDMLRDFFAVSAERWSIFWLSGPYVFLAAFMLTEPFTMPPTKRLQGWYGAIVGAVSQTFLPLGIKMTPELALLIGNAAVYPWRLRQKLFLKLIERKEIADSIYEFTFEKPTGFSFRSGQYLEWMLPHEGSDSRGIRRYFTIASASSEPVVRLALKVVENGSTYKQKLMDLEPGDTVIASQLAGDFLLPKDESKKLGFIAGGIGVTPFVSHSRAMLDAGAVRDVTFFYCVNHSDELAYGELFRQAEQTGPLSIVPVVAKEPESQYEQGFIDRDMLDRRVPDFRERIWYLSGPPPMVNAYDALLRNNGVPARQIVKDFFPGLA